MGRKVADHANRVAPGDEKIITVNKAETLCRQAYDLLK